MLVKALPAQMDGTHGRGAGFENTALHLRRKGHIVAPAVMRQPGAVCADDEHHLRRLAVNGIADILDTGFPQVAIVLKGEGKICFDEGEMQIKQGDEIFFPFDVPGAKIEGDVTVVLCHPEGVVYV